MGPEKIFTCQRCDYDIEIEDVHNTDTALCHSCGQEYRVAYVEWEEAWEPIPIEAIEEPGPERKEEEPFQVDVEPGSLDKDEFTRY